MKNIILYILFLSFSIAAQENTINVIGQSEKEISPNYVECEIGVISNSKSSEDGLKEVNLKIKDLFALVDKYKIDQKKISIQKMTVDQNTSTVRDGEDYKEINIGYKVSATYRIVITDLSKCEPFIQECFKSGINHLEYMTFKNTSIDSFSRVTYQEAIKNAEAMARTILSAQNRKLGKLLKVSFEKPDGFDVELYERGDRRWGYGVGRGGTSGGGVPEFTIPIKPAPIYLKSKIFVSYTIE